MRGFVLVRKMTFGEQKKTVKCQFFPFPFSLNSSPDDSRLWSDSSKMPVQPFCQSLTLYHTTLTFKLPKEGTFENIALKGEKACY